MISTIAYSFFKILPLSSKRKLMEISQYLIKPRLLKHFSKIIHPDDLVFDVGAYVGDYTEIFLELGARVISIDPQPFSYKELKKRFGNNKKVTIVNKGLGDTFGYFPFYISNNSPTNSTFYSDWRLHPRYKEEREWKKQLNVPVITLDKLIETYGIPQFCKIDVEGYEPKVIRGLHHTIPFLSFEFDQAFINHMVECVNHLENLGKIRFNYALYGGSAFDAKKWLTSHQLLRIIKNKVNGHLRGDIYAKFIERKKEKVI